MAASIVHPAPAPCKQTPFARLPHHVVTDPRLTDFDVRLLARLLRFARAKGFCWPCVARLAKALGVCDRTVQYALRRLEAAGYLRFERVRRSRANPTGRLIHLDLEEPAPPNPLPQPWFTPAGPGPNPRPVAPPIAPPGVQGIAPLGVQPVAPEEESLSSKEEANPRRQAHPTTTTTTAPADAPPTVRPPLPPAEAPRTPAEAIRAMIAGLTGPPAAAAPRPAGGAPRAVPRPATPAAAPAAVPGRPARRYGLRGEFASAEEMARAWQATGDPVLMAEAERILRPRPSAPAVPAPRTTGELMARIRECPSYVPRLAQALAEDLGDHRSWRGLHKLCERAWRGEIPPEALADAYRQATGPKAKNRGAVFTHALKRAPRRR